MRKKFFRIVEPSDSKNDYNYYFDVFIILLIILNVFSIIMASVQEIGLRFKTQFYIFEVFSVTVFTVEYLIRIWTCVEKKDFEKPLLGRIKFIFTPMAIIDFLAIIPFYLPFLGIDLRFLRIFRLFRIFRLLKMARYSRAFNLIKKVLKEKKEDLLVTLVFIMIILIIVSTLMYYIERDAQPENFSSIPQSLWWGIVTLTTVGYGDVYPVTILGKILGGIITLLGVGLVALPSGILASGYTEQIMIKKSKKNKKE